LVRVTVRIGGGIGGHGKVVSTMMELEDRATLATLLDMLGRDLGEDLRRPYVVVAVNGRRVADQESCTWILRDGDVVAVVGATAGG